ncbi:MAG: IPT/TIG domain-containing protein, partial [Planctomycetes bacterium]|nr:IPT/TIG domain-containing protein [Planctomycetota bacterium]
SAERAAAGAAVFRLLPLLALLLGLASAARGGEITSVTPAEGAYGTEITIAGSGFGDKEPAVALASEYVGSDPKLKILSFNDTQVVVKLKTGLEGLYDLSLDPAGKQTAAIKLKKAFEIRAPDVISVAPAAPAPGDLVTLTGAFFGTKEGSVSLGCTQGVVKDWQENQIVFKFSTNAGKGLHNVTVKNKAGQVTLCGALDIQYTGSKCFKTPSVINKVKSAMQDVLADAEHPSAELKALAEEIGEAYLDRGDPCDTYMDLLASILSAIETGADVQADATAAENSLNFIELPPPPDAKNKPKTLIIYVNGLHTPPEHALLAAGHLMKAMTDAYPGMVKNCAFEVFYNRSSVVGDPPGEIVARSYLPLGVFLALQVGEDLLKLGPDNVSPQMAPIWKSFHDTYTLGMGPFDECGSAHESLEVFAEDIENAATESGQAGLLAEEIEGGVVAGKKVILVAHSQGNNLVEKAIDQVAGDVPHILDDVGVVAIASPTPYQQAKKDVAWFKRLTLRGDAVVTLDDAPGGNLDNPLANAKNVNPCALHSVDWGYLGFAGSRKKIISAIKHMEESTSLPSLDGKWEGTYELDYYDFYGCGGFSDEGDMEMDLDGKNKSYDGDGTLEDMTAVLPFVCSKIATIDREMKVDADAKAGDDPDELEFEGEMVYTCPITGKKYEWSVKAKVDGDKMKGTLEGENGDAEGTFTLKKK